MSSSVRCSVSSCQVEDNKNDDSLATPKDKTDISAQAMNLSAGMFTSYRIVRVGHFHCRWASIQQHVLLLPMASHHVQERVQFPRYYEALGGRFRLKRTVAI